MVIVIMGVSGSGKTTVGRALARAVQGVFHDADDFHPPENVEKMQSGRPLSEQDREPWLQRLHGCIDEWLRAPAAVVLACSALTRRSRELLGTGRDGVRLVFLRGPAPLIESRLHGRRHFMPPELLASQFETLEPPAHALVLDVRQPVSVLVEQIREACGI